MQTTCRRLLRESIPDSGIATGFVNWRSRVKTGVLILIAALLPGGTSCALPPGQQAARTAFDAVDPLTGTACGTACSQAGWTNATDAVDARSPDYQRTQQRLASGWNTWDVHSVATQVLLPEGLAIHVGLKHITTVSGDAFLGDVLIGRQDEGAEVVTPGPHSWNGDYTELTVTWKGHTWRVQSAHAGDDLVLLTTPLGSREADVLPPAVVFSVNFLWNRPGTVARLNDRIRALSASGADPIEVYCTCLAQPAASVLDLSVSADYFAAALVTPVGVSTGKRRSLDEIQTIIERQRLAYEQQIQAAGKSGPVLDAIETTLGWDTIYEAEKKRVVSPVSRGWSVSWGGYVLFDWDTFFAAAMAGIGDKDLAYANTLEILREETPAGFVPNYARAGGWKSFDRSEPPVGAITVLDLYKRFHDHWFIENAFVPLLRWNRWWTEHRDIDGYLTWGSDGENQPENLNDGTRGTQAGAVLESGLDNSPMYDGTVYDAKKHVLEYADVGLMSMYVADCDALAQLADILTRPAEARELRARAEKYRTKLQTMWDEDAEIFLNLDLHTGRKSMRLSPTNFYPLLAKAATAKQARAMLAKHLKNPKEFWGEWVIPSIARNDPAFKDQEYWRGRIWGPMNYLVYLGLKNYDCPELRKEFADRSYALFLKEWKEKEHVHENYNAIFGTGDDAVRSDRFYHWGALLGYVEYLEQDGDEH